LKFIASVLDAFSPNVPNNNAYITLPLTMLHRDDSEIFYLVPRDKDSTGLKIAERIDFNEARNSISNLIYSTSV
jgi:hypothetical protein